MVNLTHRLQLPETRKSLPITTQMDSWPLNIPERKQKETPPTTSTETMVVTKRIKAEGSGTRGHVRQADFDELMWSVIEETVSIYHAQIGSVKPFPERAEDRNTVKQAWLEVCTGRNVRVELEEDVFKLVSNGSSSFIPWHWYLLADYWTCFASKRVHEGHLQAILYICIQRQWHWIEMGDSWQHRTFIGRILLHLQGEQLLSLSDIAADSLYLGSCIKNGNISCPSASNYCQQGLVQEQRGRRCYTSGIFGERRASDSYHCICADCGKSVFWQASIGSNVANTAFRLKITSTSGLRVNTSMSLSQLRPTRVNTLFTSNSSWILKRKHTRLISFLVYLGICLRWLGKFIVNWCCCSSTYFVCIENMLRFPGKQHFKLQRLQMLKLRLKNRNGPIWYCRMMSRLFPFQTVVYRMLRENVSAVLIIYPI